MRACIGMCSQMAKPGTLVEIGLNSPRISSAASGFMSYRSMWLGPPGRYTKMTDLGGDDSADDDLASAPRASNRRSAASDSPPKARVPTDRKLRRDGPEPRGRWP